MFARRSELKTSVSQTFATTLTNLDAFACLGGFRVATRAPGMKTICCGAFADPAAFNSKVTV